MRIYDPDTKKVLKSVTLFLTPSEASQLASFASDLAADPSLHHSHVSDDDFESEVTVAVYTQDNMNQFDAESRRVIESELE